MKKSINTKKARGFTIVELLVVIVVIGILAAISIVSYSGVTNKAKSTQIVSNASAVIDMADMYNAEKGEYPSTIASLTSLGTVNLPGVTISSTAPTSIATAMTTVGYTVCTTVVSGATVYSGAKASYYHLVNGATTMTTGSGC